VVQWDLLHSPIGARRFDGSEPAQDYDSPFAADSLSKFNTSPLFHEIYSAGTLRVYQVASAVESGKP